MLFEHLANEDDSHIVAQRQAAAVAHKVIKSRFAAFVANASTPEEFDSRLALVGEDITAVVAEVAAEYGSDVEHVTAAVKVTWEHLKEYQFKKKDDKGDSDDDDDSKDSDDESGEDSDSDDDDDKKSSSTKESRRPKMCPYHSEVTDISLGTGDAKAGFSAMADHAWGKSHCKGGFGGTCNFKPAMVTQQYWDDKKAEYEQRRQERDERNQAPDLSIDTEPVMTQEPLPDEPGEGITDIDGELAEAPSAVGHGIAPTEPMSMAASHTGADAPSGAGGAVKREKLPTGDETALGGPPVKIDKGNSGDQNGWSLDKIDTQSENSPHPTVEQDPTDKADFDKKDFKDQTEGAGTKQVDLPANSGDAGFTDGKQNHGPHTDTWTGTEGLANPVSSTKVTIDPDKNPLREIIESQFDGFLPSTTVESAISEFESAE